MHRNRSWSGVLALAFLTVAEAQPPAIGKCTVLPADNIWNTPVDQLPVAANSAAYINTISSTAPVHADFGAGLYDGGPIGIPFITVPGTQTKYPATFLYADESDPGPYAIPLNAPIEGGSQSTGDRHTIAVDIDNCILYELYSAYPQAASWQAGSGAIFNLLSDALRPAGWTSTDAAGLPILPDRSHAVRRDCGRRDSPCRQVYGARDTARVRLARAPLCIESHGSQVSPDGPARQTASGF
ncbi:exported hypothetical protein [Candidatus Sulfopaludibacter sp. SbA4]|nr:exported hypothetical protein [Candidatus Sulfopaludibacter sp. SbA4]